MTFILVNLTWAISWVVLLFHRGDEASGPWPRA